MDPKSMTAVYILLSNSYAFQENDISKLKTEYRNCPSDQYFFIPLTLIPFNPLKLNSSYHANGIFISKPKGTVFRIEPQYYQIQDMKQNSKEINIQQQNKIKSGIIQLVTEIGLKDPTYIDITVPCPQTIVEDNNCIFWSQYMFESIVKNLYKKDINTVIKDISSKPKAELQKLIYEYKLDFFGRLIPDVLKKYNIEWPDFENNKERISREIQNEYNIIIHPISPLMGVHPVNLGGKTRKSKKSTGLLIF